MPDTDAAPPKGKKPIQVLREQRGGVPRELLERNRRQKAIRKKIMAALQDGPKTVSELACTINQPAGEVFWYVMGMKKYGKVCEAGQEGEYFRYALVCKTHESEN